MIMIIIRAVTITSKIALMMIKKNIKYKSLRGEKKGDINKTKNYPSNIHHQSKIWNVDRNNIEHENSASEHQHLHGFRQWRHSWRLCPATVSSVKVSCRWFFFSFLSPLIKMFGVGNVDCDWIKRRRNMYFKSSLCLLSFESFRGKIESLKSNEHRDGNIFYCNVLFLECSGHLILSVQALYT